MQTNFRNALFAPMHALDIGIIAAYLLSVVLLGVYLTWRTRRLKAGVRCMCGIDFLCRKCAVSHQKSARLASEIAPNTHNKSNITSRPFIK